MKNDIKKFWGILILIVLTLSGCGTESTENSVINLEENGAKDTEEVEYMLEFEEDWYLKYYYYMDSNGDYFILKHSDTIFQINIADIGSFNVDFSKYRIEEDSEYGNVYVYYDVDSYILVKYYPQLNNTIIIEDPSGDIVCTNISEAEYLEAERNYANSQLEGFEADWYKDKYLSTDTFEGLRDFYLRNDYLTFDGGGCRQIKYNQITNTSDIFILEVDPVFAYMSENVVVEFFSDEYEIDYENYGYIYETTYSNVIVYLEYFPKDNKIKVYDEYESMGGAVTSKKTYWLISEEEIEELSTLNSESVYEDDNTSDVGF